MASAEQLIRNSFFEDVIRLSPIAMIAIDDQGRLRFHNQAASDLFQIRLELSIDEPVSDVLQGFDPRKMRTVAEAIEVISVESNRRHLVDFHHKKIQVDEEVWSILFLTDAEPRRAKELSLQAEASTDLLSGLTNRRGFQKALELNIHRWLSLAIVDVDQFKTINDDFGHAVGDEAIQFVGKLMTEYFQGSAICVSRFGGDEFGVILATTEERKQVELLLDGFRELFASQKFSSHNLSLSVSVGLAISEIAGTTSRELLTAADEALYRAKKAGRNRVCKSVIQK